jgi:multidrug efflux system outer membrane protein
MKTPYRRFIFSVSALSIVLSACTVGPKYVRPSTSLPEAFVEARQDFYKKSSSPTMWSMFQDATLDQLITWALERNKTLAQAQARVNEARALRGLETFALFPTVTASSGQEKIKSSRRDPFIPPDLLHSKTVHAGFDAAWEIDLFGGDRQLRRVARANELATNAALEAVRLSMVAETAQAYFTLLSEQQRQLVQQRQIDNLKESQKIFELRRDLGRSSDLDVARIQSLMLASSAKLPMIDLAIARQEQRLAVLTASSVDALRQLISKQNTQGSDDGQDMVSVGTPEEWLLRRPDVREAEQQLVIATAQVGVNIADFFPHLKLLGSWGWTAQQAGQIGDADAERWRWGPSLAWSFLDVGRVRQRVKASRARAEGVLANYELTILQAMEETENALAGYRAANRAAHDLALALEQGRRATQLARLRFEAGATDSLILLDAERSEFELEDQWLSARAQKQTALVALYKALSGDFVQLAK